jgi:hypothetical protein
MFGSKKAAQPAPMISTEELVQLFPRMAETIGVAASRTGTSPCDMQSTFWFQAVNP